MRLSGVLELVPWVLQQLLVSVAYVFACHGIRYRGNQKENTAGMKKRNARYAMEGVILLLIFTFLGIAADFIFKSSPFLVVWSVVQWGALALYLHFFSEYRSKTKFIVWCSMIAGLQSLTSIAGQISYLTGAYLGKGWPEAAARVFVYLLIPLLAVYLSRWNFDDFEKLPVPGLILILCGDFSLMCLVVTESVWPTTGIEEVKRFLVTYLCLLIIVLASIYALYSVCKGQDSIMLLREEKQQLEKEKERFYMAKEQMEEIRSIRHDLKNQRSYMKILLQEKRYQELENYFSETDPSFSVPKNYVNCGNKSVNVILNMEYAKVDSQITIDSLLVVPPVLPYQDDELCSLLTNLLDNAIEECRRIREKGETEPKIRLEIYPEANYLYILCCNTTDKSTLSYWMDGVRSTKEDQVQHGYGTQIVARIAEKYNGCAEYSVQDGYFTAKILMEMTGGQQHD